MKKFTKVFSILMLSCFLLTSCYTNTHVVGSGGGSGEKVEKKHWYFLGGLVPLNSVDSKAMAGGKADYTVTTSMTFVDVLISVVTNFVAITPMTVKVQK